MASPGNFATWHSMHYQGGSSSTTTFSFGNCRVGTTSGGYPIQISNFAFPTSGKWYIELNNIVNNNYHCFGIIRQANMLYGLCEEYDANYDLVKAFLIEDGTLGITHWDVPGPDGKLGFGGKCLPKDTTHYQNLFSEDKLYEDVLKYARK